MKGSTLTVSDTSGFAVGGGLSMYEKDSRLWKRFWYFITFRNPPMVRVMYKITAMTDTTLTVRKV